MDTHLTTLILEIMFSLAVSALVLAILRPVLRAMLLELCRLESRAAFWDTFSRLMLYIAPLLVVILLSHSGSKGEIILVQAVRATLLHSLLGQFTGLLIIGKVLLNFSRRHDASIPRPDEALTVPADNMEK